MYKHTYTTDNKASMRNKTTNTRCTTNKATTITNKTTNTRRTTGKLVNKATKHLIATHGLGCAVRTITTGLLTSTHAT